jgi:hypothetical protein
MAIAAWIGTVQARRKMGKKLGRKVEERELTSLSTWMDAGKSEEKK